MTTKIEDPRVDDLVMIRLGAAQRLHVAHLEAVDGSLFVVRKFLPNASGDDGLPGAWAKHTVKLPRSMVTAVDQGDPRLEAAKAALGASGIPVPKKPAAKKLAKRKPKKRTRKKAASKTTKKTPRRASAPATVHPEGT